MEKVKTMVKVNIDGAEIQAEAGQTVLEAASENNVYIPTLCHHESIEPYGACRLCMVEVTARGRQRLVTSCLYGVEEGLTVRTDTPRVQKVRRMVMQLLLARCPESKVLQDMAAKLGVEKTPFKADGDHGNCILCALCTRACEEVVGRSAISLVDRGVERKVSTPFEVASETCIACGSCAYVCPTGAIALEDKGDTRTIRMPNVTMDFKLKTCNNCGRCWAPEKQLEFMRKSAELAEDAFELCPDCRP